MHFEEYEKVKNYTYLEYCDYLQKKYGLAPCAYFRPSWTRNPKASRAKEGLMLHHKYEDHAIMLSNALYAQKNPYEWQEPQNLVYCDYLEHLLLHILICEYPSDNKNEREAVGIGGVINYIVPELNDFYSGFEISLAWKKACFDLVSGDEDTYLTLIERFINIPLMIESLVSSDIKVKFPDYKYHFLVGSLCKSVNAGAGMWSNDENQKIYKKIMNLITKSL